MNEFTIDIIKFANLLWNLPLLSSKLPLYCRIYHFIVESTSFIVESTTFIGESKKFIVEFTIFIIKTLLLNYHHSIFRYIQDFQPPRFINNFPNHKSFPHPTSHYLMLIKTASSQTPLK